MDILTLNGVQKYKNTMMISPPAPVFLEFIPWLIHPGALSRWETDRGGLIFPPLERCGPRAGGLPGVCLSGGGRTPSRTPETPTDQTVWTANAWPPTFPTSARNSAPITEGDGADTAMLTELSSPWLRSSRHQSGYHHDIAALIGMVTAVTKLWFITGSV